MKNKALLTIIICTIVSVMVVNKIYSQAARPAPVSTMSGAASLDPGGKSTGTIDWRTDTSIIGLLTCMTGYKSCTN